MDRDETALMYQVAENWEAQVLDELRERAGITWTCWGDDDDVGSCWTNDAADAACDNCGRPRPEVSP